MLSEQLTGGFDGGEIAFGNFPVCVDGIPFKLAFYVRDEIAGLVRAHVAESDFVSGVVGLSAASSSHVSSLGVMSKGFAVVRDGIDRVGLLLRRKVQAGF
jgi:hypothetical protein